MRYSILIEPVDDSEKMAGFFYAHVPSLGLTTHGSGVEGAMSAARDLVSVWLEEKRACGEVPVAARESLLASIEVD